MNTTQLKNYAPAAREAFIAAVSARAARLGITDKEIAPEQIEGDVLLVQGRAFPRGIAPARKTLVDRVRTQGFDATMEAIAYTWFNRLAALRYMELHDYLDHGYRVLSHPENLGRPEILDHAADIDLPGLDRDRVVELKLDGAKDEDLYRQVLLAQCDALHRAMPFLFDRIGSETELLLPANLLHTDSLIRKMVEDIDEDTWDEIEIIGWLYQFYISDKKDQVMGKVVASEDIPAATQLFTPNWIVKYMVQNSLGAQWLATYPHSPLKGQMDYYIEPAEQTDKVQAQLAAITPDTLDPEALTLMDPACGSGHILVEAYDLFKAIYLERGYRRRDVAKLILEKNLYGLDIDGRAAQLTGFALLMKGRADDRRLFGRGVKLNVMALVNSTGFYAERLAQGVELADFELRLGDLTGLKRLFESATTFGSLIQVPVGLSTKLSAMKRLSETTSRDLFVSDALGRIGPLVWQAEMLAARYDAVVANPPYMGSKGMPPLLKKFAKDHFPDSKRDLFACFIERSYTLSNAAAYSAMVTMQSWMFLSSFQQMRERMLCAKTICTMAHLGARAFGSISGEVVQTTACVLKNRLHHGYKPVFFRLVNGGEEEKQTALANGTNRYDTTAQAEFAKIPGSPLAYWVSGTVRDAFVEGLPLCELAKPKHGMTTFNNDRFLRLWHEIDIRTVNRNAANREDALSSGAKWFPYNKGGSHRKWFGNAFFLINWQDDGKELKDFIKNKNPNVACGESFFFREGITWADIATKSFSARFADQGSLFDVKGSSAFPEAPRIPAILGLMNSKLMDMFMGILNPTVTFQVGDIGRVPFLDQPSGGDFETQHIFELIGLSRDDWNSYEHSWDFQSSSLLTASSEPASLESSYTSWITQSRTTIAEMKRIEEESNRLFIDAYGLQNELTPEVPIGQITLTVNPDYRYGGKGTEEEQWARFRQDTMAELVSYAIGCMMGRYSLDEPGLIYAHNGSENFDHNRYATFPADDDGIIPLTDTGWFDDDACNRLVEFISVAWDKGNLEDNLTFLAGNLKPKKNESSRDTIRRYLCDTFFKDHLKTYKKRPIYWLFSSGKKKAFQCLVYLHRYNEGTLSRMRSEYVIPLQGKMAARIENLQGDILVATSTAHRKRMEKERDKLDAQQVELLAFDEKLRHYADRRIVLDLDDGVKVNYGKFGDLLAEVKKVHGKKPVSA